MSKCKYHKTCKGYKENDFTCQSDYEADDYCGHYKKFEEERLSKPLWRRILIKLNIYKI